MTSTSRTATEPVHRVAAAGTDGRAATAPILNAMSVDVEDYFQVQALAGVVDRADWDSIACRVEANTQRLLDMYAEAGVTITFFTLGWVAERYPALIRRMVAEGHELASHGLQHARADIRRAKAILEDAGGVPVRGYRAATFSINASNPWAFDVLAEEGHAYSSSIYPVKHDLYGVPDAPRTPYRPRPGVDLVEIPMTTVRLGGRNLPCSGGGYFRLLPYALFRTLVRRVNRVDGQPAVFYMHPWEVDPDQPRVAGLSAKSRFRHYVGLAGMQGKLARLLGDFAWSRMDRAFAASLNGR